MRGFINDTRKSMGVEDFTCISFEGRGGWRRVRKIEKRMMGEATGKERKESRKWEGCDSDGEFGSQWMQDDKMVGDGKRERGRKSWM